jgi:hypothetical protein
MTRHQDCPHCRAPLPAPRSRALGRFVLVLAYTTMLAFSVVFACLGAVGLTLLPFFLPGAIACITSAHTFASEDALCPACGKLVEHEHERTIAAPVPSVVHV